MRKPTLFFAAFSAILALPVAAPAADRLAKEGLWEITTSVEMEGMPEAHRIPPTTFTHCVTPQEAKDPGAMIRKSQERNTDCKMTDVRVDGNKVTWAMDCEKNHMRGSGEMTYHSDTYEGTMRMQISGGPHGDMKMTSHMKGKRLGDCK